MEALIRLDLVSSEIFSVTVRARFGANPLLCPISTVVTIVEIINLCDFSPLSEQPFGAPGSMWSDLFDLDLEIMYVIDGFYLNFQVRLM